MKPTYLIAMALLLALSGASQAQESDYEVTELGSRTPTEEEIISALTPRPPLVSRSVDGEPPPPMKLRAIPLRIRFGLDSYELSDEAQQTLNRLGAALTSDALASFQFRIEGHTDASGDENYNLDLSRRRAEGVRNYLVNLFEMDGGRLETVARGEGSLLNPDEPTSADNRVVLIVNLGPKG